MSVRPSIRAASHAAARSPNRPSRSVPTTTPTVSGSVRTRSLLVLLPDSTAGQAARRPHGELARRTGIATSALRYYEDRGLIHAVRTAAGHRRYARPTIRRVAFVVFAQRVGLSLDEVRAELDRLPVERIPTSDDWADLTSTWRARIDARIAELIRLRDSLTGCIGCGCLSLDRCAVLNPADQAGQRGPGPRYWLGDALPVGDGAGKPG